MNRIMAVLVFILLLTAGWIGWQRVQIQEGRQRLDELQGFLETEAGEIGGIEKDLLNQAEILSGIEANISALNGEIQEFESAHPDGIPEELYAGYENQVSRYNGLVSSYNATLDQYNEVFEDYTSRVKEFNVLAEEANGLSVQLGASWTIGQWESQAGSQE